MKLGKTLASVAIASSLLVSPIAAQAAVAERASAAVEGEELGGSPVILGVLLLAVVGVAAWLLAESDNADDDDGAPVSP